jgi:hypothetical protein
MLEHDSRPSGLEKVYPLHPEGVIMSRQLIAMNPKDLVDPPNA